ncbi:MAG: DUF4833 domain-containing protein, partial [Bacteroidia bacterium]
IKFARKLLKGTMRLNFKGLCSMAMLFLLFTSFVNEPTLKESKVFPKPERTKTLLFYVQRTFNTNTLMYEMNMDDKGLVDLNNPIKIYWKNYAGKGDTESLSYIQRRYAYGLEVKLTDAEKKSFVFNFVSYKKKQIYLIKSTVENRYDAFIQINNRLLILSRVFIQIEGGSFWVPKIKYIEVTGKDVSKNEEVVERIIP